MRRKACAAWRPGSPAASSGARNASARSSDVGLSESRVLSRAAVPGWFSSTARSRPARAATCAAHGTAGSARRAGRADRHATPCQAARHHDAPARPQPPGHEGPARDRLGPQLLHLRHVSTPWSRPETMACTRRDPPGIAQNPVPALGNAFHPERTVASSRSGHAPSMRSACKGPHATRSPNRLTARCAASAARVAAGANQEGTLWPSCRGRRPRALNAASRPWSPVPAPGPPRELAGSAFPSFDPDH